jgi:phosphocarrier protein
MANKFDARITVRHDDEEVNGKSIMGILMLGVEKDSLIVVEADGMDAEAALVELEKLIISEEEL